MFILISHFLLFVGAAHGICMFYKQPGGLPSICVEGRKIDLTNGSKEHILSVINGFRIKVAKGEETGKDGGPLPKAYGMRQLHWDNQLTSLAEVSAKDCRSRPELCNATDVFPNQDQCSVTVQLTQAGQLLMDNNRTTVNNVTEEKVTYAIDSALNQMYRNKDWVTRSKIDKHQGSNPYLTMVYGWSSHVGCGMTVFFNADQGQEMNDVMLVCNFSHRPTEGQKIYETEPPHKERVKLGWSAKCGCEPGLFESEDCLCSGNVLSCLLDWSCHTDPKNMNAISNSNNSTIVPISSNMLLQAGNDNNISATDAISNVFNSTATSISELNTDRPVSLLMNTMKSTNFTNKTFDISNTDQTSKARSETSSESTFNISTADAISNILNATATSILELNTDRSASLLMNTMKSTNFTYKTFDMSNTYQTSKAHSETSFESTFNSAADAISNIFNATATSILELNTDKPASLLMNTMTSTNFTSKTFDISNTDQTSNARSEKSSESTFNPVTKSLKSGTNFATPTPPKSYIFTNSQITTDSIIDNNITTPTTNATTEFVPQITSQKPDKVTNESMINDITRLTIHNITDLPTNVNTNQSNSNTITDPITNNNTEPITSTFTKGASNNNITHIINVSNLNAVNQIKNGNTLRRIINITDTIAKLTTSLIAIPINNASTKIIADSTTIKSNTNISKNAIFDTTVGFTIYNNNNSNELVTSDMFASNITAKLANEVITHIENMSNVNTSLKINLTNTTTMNSISADIINFTTSSIKPNTDTLTFGSIYVTDEVILNNSTELKTNYPRKLVTDPIINFTNFNMNPTIKFIEAPTANTNDTKVIANDRNQTIYFSTFSADNSVNTNKDHLTINTSNFTKLTAELVPQITSQKPDKVTNKSIINDITRLNIYNISDLPTNFTIIESTINKTINPITNNNTGPITSTEKETFYNNITYVPNVSNLNDASQNNKNTSVLFTNITDTITTLSTNLITLSITNTFTKLTTDSTTIKSNTNINKDAIFDTTVDSTIYNSNELVTSETFARNMTLKFAQEIITHFENASNVNTSLENNLTDTTATNPIDARNINFTTPSIKPNTDALTLGLKYITDEFISNKSTELKTNYPHELVTNSIINFTDLNSNPTIKFIKAPTANADEVKVIANDRNQTTYFRTSSVDNSVNTYTDESTINTSNVTKLTAKILIANSTANTSLNINLTDTYATNPIGARTIDFTASSIRANTDELTFGLKYITNKFISNNRIVLKTNYSRKLVTDPIIDFTDSSYPTVQVTTVNAKSIKGIPKLPISMLKKKLIRRIPTSQPRLQLPIKTKSILSKLEPHLLKSLIAQPSSGSIKLLNQSLIPPLKPLIMAPDELPQHLQRPPYVPSTSRIMTNHKKDYRQRIASFTNSSSCEANCLSLWQALEKKIKLEMEVKNLTTSIVDAGSRYGRKIKTKQNSITQRNQLSKMLPSPWNMIGQPAKSNFPSRLKKTFENNVEPIQILASNTKQQLLIKPNFKSNYEPTTKRNAGPHWKKFFKNTTGSIRNPSYSLKPKWRLNKMKLKQDTRTQKNTETKYKSPEIINHINSTKPSRFPATNTKPRTKPSKNKFKFTPLKQHKISKNNTSIRKQQATYIKLSKKPAFISSSTNPLRTKTFTNSRKKLQVLKNNTKEIDNNTLTKKEIKPTMNVTHKMIQKDIKKNTNPIKIPAKNTKLSKNSVHRQNRTQTVKTKTNKLSTLKSNTKLTRKLATSTKSGNMDIKYITTQPKTKKKLAFKRIVKQNKKEATHLEPSQKFDSQIKSIKHAHIRKQQATYIKPSKKPASKSSTNPIYTKKITSSSKKQRILRNYTKKIDETTSVKKKIKPTMTDTHKTTKKDLKKNTSPTRMLATNTERSKNSGNKLDWKKTIKPKINKPKTNKPKTNKPKTNKPKTNKPKTNKPKTNKPKTNKPKTNKPKTNKPKTNKPKTNKPKTNKLLTLKSNTKLIRKLATSTKSTTPALVTTTTPFTTSISPGSLTDTPKIIEEQDRCSPNDPTCISINFDIPLLPLLHETSLKKQYELEQSILNTQTIKPRYFDNKQVPFDVKTNLNQILLGSKNMEHDINENSFNTIESLNNKFQKNDEDAYDMINKNTQLTVKKNEPPEDNSRINTEYKNDINAENDLDTMDKYSLTYTKVSLTKQYELEQGPLNAHTIRPRYFDNKQLSSDAKRDSNQILRGDLSKNIEYDMNENSFNTIESFNNKFRKNDEAAYDIINKNTQLTVNENELPADNSHINTEYNVMRISNDLNAENDLDTKYKHSPIYTKASLTKQYELEQSTLNAQTIRPRYFDSKQVSSDAKRNLNQILHGDLSKNIEYDINENSFNTIESFKFRKNDEAAYDIVNKNTKLTANKNERPVYNSRINTEYDVKRISNDINAEYDVDTNYKHSLTYTTRISVTKSPEFALSEAEESIPVLADLHSQENVTPEILLASNVLAKEISYLPQEENRFDKEFENIVEGYKNDYNSNSLQNSLRSNLRKDISKEPSVPTTESYYDSKSDLEFMKQLDAAFKEYENNIIPEEQQVPASITKESIFGRVPRLFPAQKRNNDNAISEVSSIKSEHKNAMNIIEYALEDGVITTKTPIPTQSQRGSALYVMDIPENKQAEFDYHDEKNLRRYYNNVSNKLDNKQTELFDAESVTTMTTSQSKSDLGNDKKPLIYSQNGAPVVSQNDVQPISSKKARLPPKKDSFFRKVPRFTLSAPAEIKNNATTKQTFDIIQLMHSSTELEDDVMSNPLNYSENTAFRNGKSSDDERMNADKRSDSFSKTNDIKDKTNHHIKTLMNAIEPKPKKSVFEYRSNNKTDVNSNRRKWISFLSSSDEEDNETKLRQLLDNIEKENMDKDLNPIEEPKEKKIYGYIFKTSV